jgi:hypothetical protein
MRHTLLRTFIRESISDSLFGLDRFVSINAFNDVVGGPDGPVLSSIGMYVDAHKHINDFDEQVSYNTVSENFDEIDDDMEH